MDKTRHPICPHCKKEDVTWWDQGPPPDVEHAQKFEHFCPFCEVPYNVMVLKFAVGEKLE